MLYKGYLGAYEGVWLSYGNAASAVGNVPGSLSAWLIGGPLLLWDSPYAPMVLLLAMRLVGFLLFDAVIRQVFDDRVRLLFLVLCWLNPWFQYESLLYNPSYLFLFSAMHCWS
ncbi:MAG: 3-deoxy-D-manno-octulosonic acid transferase, partial [Aeromonas veronii]